MTEVDRLSACRNRIEALEQEIRRLQNVESDLRESEEKYRLLVENANDAIFIVQDGQVKFPNAKGREIGRQLGLELEEVPFVEYVHPEDRGMVIDRHLRRLKGEDMPNVYSFRLLGGNGSQIWVALNAVRITWEGRPATLNFLRDITAQKELETRLDQARKLEALGTLAGGAAHDFNNLLMSIRADANAMRLRADTTAAHRKALDGILHSVASGASLTKQLLDFARRHTLEFRPFDPNRLLRETAAMFDRTQPGITIHYDCEEKPWTVEADPPQLERVLLNLFLNAAQAMPGGGNLRLITRNETLDRKEAVRLGLPPGQYVRISVADDGPGMDEATLERVFEPFFTTKEKSEGTGLGLACAFGIVECHRGRLMAVSRKGVGSRFDVFLPVSTRSICIDAPLEEGTPETVCLPNELTWLNTVLLVDDDRLVVTAVTRMLQKQGVRVLSAGSGESAVALLENRPEDIDLVIIDMLKPQAGGAEAFNRMRALRPEARFLLAGGCDVDDETCRILNGGGIGFIQKPYGAKELYAKIQEIAA